LKKLRLILAGVESVELIISKTLMVLMVASVTLQIFFRYVLNNPLPWPEELCGFLIIWLTFLIADVLYKRESHNSVDFITRKLSKAAQQNIHLGIHTFTGIFLAVLFYNSILLFIRQKGIVVGASLKIPRSIYTLSAIVCSFSMFLSSICFVARDLADIFKRHKTRS
jgi:TRAP-type C4-dicarboxylate transport system permease small subunit